jgi:hypothetical protein
LAKAISHRHYDTLITDQALRSSLANQLIPRNQLDKPTFDSSANTMSSYEHTDQHDAAVWRDQTGDARQAIQVIS